MNQPKRVSRGHAFNSLDGKIEKSRKVAGGSDRHAVDKLHHQVIRPDIVERADIGVVERSHSPRFAIKSLSELFIGHFDGDDPTQPHVPGFVNATHPASPDGSKDLVWTELCA